MSTTAFEASGGTAMTTLAQEATFINALVAANPTKVTKVVLGQSVQGRDVYALRFGTGTGAPLLMTTTVHGDETLPREAALTLARDLCETTHPWATLLTQRQLVLIPTPNPDGFVAQSRNNANGLDLNRQFVPYTANAPEARRIVDLFHDNLPAAVYDGHEWNGNPNDCFVGIGNFSATDPTIRAASVATATAIQTALLTWGAANAGWYPQPSPETSLQHLCCLMGVPFFLMETCEVNYGNPALYQGRHDRHRVAMNKWLDWMATNAADYATLGAQARARMATKIARGDYSWHLYHLTPMPPASWWQASARTVMAASYTAGNLSTVSAALNAHRITYAANTGNVGLTQPGAALAAFLCDQVGLNLGACTRNPPPTITSQPPPTTPSPAHQLWSSIVT